MTTQYTPSLRLALPGTGELDGLWGEVVNNQITELLEQAVTGHVTINTWTSNTHVLTSTDGVLDEARAAVLIIELGSANPALPLVIDAPAAAKLYTIVNTTATTVQFHSVGAGSNLIDIAPYCTATIACDGTISRYTTNVIYDLRSVGLEALEGAAVQNCLAVTPSTSVTLNANDANFFYLNNSFANLNMAIALTSGVMPSTSSSVSFIVLLINPGSGTLTWPSNVRWPNNLAPIINSNTANLFVFTSFTAVPFWYGAVLNNYPAV